jgi:hypothetical protein
MNAELAPPYCDASLCHLSVVMLHSKTENELSRAMSEGASTSQRKEFTPPKLVYLGSVRVLTMGRSGSKADGNSGMAQPMMSDARAKESIVEIGWHPLGFGVYLFSYLPSYHHHFGSGRQLGVLAAEVEGVFPEAVSVDGDGLKRVDYDRLGIFPANCRG